MIQQGFILDFVLLSKQFYGNTTFQKLAMHSVVRLLASTEIGGACARLLITRNRTYSGSHGRFQIFLHCCHSSQE